MTLFAKLVAKTDLSADISSFRFAPLSGRFSGLEPGAHIDVPLGPDLVRQYSLCDWDEGGDWLEVAVKREAAGRGGSLAMHALEIGDMVPLGKPRNHFALQDRVAHATLIAGGIGATPILAMARELAKRDADLRVVYLVRSRADAALHDRFAALGLGDRYRLHCDDAEGLCDIPALLRAVPPGGDVYCCGPEPMLNAVLAAEGELCGGKVRLERFAAASNADAAPKAGFEVELVSCGTVLPVGPEQSILGVLRDHGLPIEFGCAEGLCGACMTDVIEGEIDHRDGVLTPEEQAGNAFMCICVSRARSARLVLDL